MTHICSNYYCLLLLKPTISSCTVYASGNANLRSILIQHQLRQSDSSQQGSWKLHRFGIEGNDSELSKNPLYVNIMLCGLCVVLTFFHNYVTFCAII